ncbi:unnamed protein product, partial [Pylaiella littoralis]
MQACGDLELCKLPNKPLGGNHGGHTCRFGCGALLHGICGEVVEVLANLDIAPGTHAHPGAIKVMEEWVGLEEQPEFADSLCEDAKEVFMEKVNNTYEEEADSDDEPDNAEDS